MKKVVSFLLVAVLTMAVASPAFAADAFWRFTLKDKRGIQDSYAVSDNWLEKKTEAKKAALLMVTCSPKPSSTIRACIVNYAATAAVTEGLWYTYGGKAAKPKFLSVSSVMGRDLRAAFRMNTKEKRDVLTGEGKYTVDYTG
ncbi:hypothetical protein ACH6CV_11735 [Bacillota bacterium Meth-B3]